MVRLVFRPYTQVRRSICTLESLRTFIRVSPDFVLLKHSSPSFGSQHVCSYSNLSPVGSWSVDSAMVLPQWNHFHFHYAQGISSRTLAHMLDSLVRVSRRVDKRHFVQVYWEKSRALDHSGRGSFSPFPRKLDSTEVVTAFHRFLFSNFRYSLTLFSKFFSSFPHGTCLLSVSLRYLALDGIYHPLRAAVPNNSTQ